jgi:hypothetical protein
MSKRLAAVLAVAASVAAAPPVAPAAARSVHRPVAAIARTCSAGFTHAVIGGKQKCLRRGEFCTHSLDRQYRRYGYRCVRYYANVARYRLT